MSEVQFYNLSVHFYISMYIIHNKSNVWNTQIFLYDVLFLKICKQ